MFSCKLYFSLGHQFFWDLHWFLQMYT